MFACGVENFNIFDLVTPSKLIHLMYCINYESNLLYSSFDYTVYTSNKFSDTDLY